MVNVEAKLAEAITRLESREFIEALYISQQIIQIQPCHLDALHMAALSSRKLQNLKQASVYFMRCLEISATQPAILGNYANLLVQTGDYQLANEHYRSAHSLDVLNIEILYNWANLLSNRLRQPQEALSLINKSLTIDQSQSRLFACRGNILSKEKRFDEADRDYASALQLAPGDFEIILNRGLNYRISGKPQKAITCYNLIIDLNRDNAGLWFNMGCAHYDIGEYNRAEESLKKALNLAPNFVEAHDAINQLYWVSGDNHKFLESFAFTRSRKAYNADIFLAHARTLLNANFPEKAGEILREGLDYFPRGHALLHALGCTNIKLDEVDTALELLSEAVNSAPDNIRYRIDLASGLVQDGGYNEALTHLHHAGDLDPLNQEVLAFKGTCWRLLEDSNADWLNDYDRFVDAQLLEAPEEYDDLEHFLHELRSVLLKMHTTQRQPLDQSVVGGTQTLGNLLQSDNPVIQHYKNSLQKRVRDYVLRLDREDKHPFLRRQKENFRFSGAWSVKLASNGFHTNHVHPEGWISGNTYIDVPNGISSEDTAQAGWLTMGLTSMLLGSREKMKKVYCPTPGLCILFPSYIWHGTRPFIDNTYRLSAPFDVQPCD